MTLVVEVGAALGTQRVLRLQQEVRYDYAAPVARLRQRLVVVPPAVHGGQRRGDWSCTVSGASSPTRRTRTDRFGNVVIDVTAPRVERFVRFAVDVTVTVDVAVTAPVDPAPDAYLHTVATHPRYLRPTPLTRADEAVLALAAGTAEPAEICRRVHGALTYEWGITGVHTPAAEALAGGRGVCQDYAHVMVAACRAVGIEARYVSGHLVGEGGSHAWVEVLRPHPQHPDRRIVEAWDPTHDRRTDPGYLTVAVGRDYADVAPLSGSYVGDGTAGRLTVGKRLHAPEGGRVLGSGTATAPGRHTG